MRHVGVRRGARWAEAAAGRPARAGARLTTVTFVREHEKLDKNANGKSKKREKGYGPRKDSHYERCLEGKGKVEEFGRRMAKRRAKKRR